MLSCYPLSSGTRTGNRISKKGERDGRPDQALVLIDRDSLCADLVKSRANRKYLENGGLVPRNALVLTGLATFRVVGYTGAIASL